MQDSFQIYSLKIYFAVDFLVLLAFGDLLPEILHSTNIF